MTSVREYPSHYGNDRPLRLALAAKVAFPDGSMTASGLRREAKRGRLVVERIAGKDYTTLDAIQEMRRLCRVEAKGRACGSNQPEVKQGRILEHAVWVIRDGGTKRSTGAGPREVAKAEKAFAAYLNLKVAPRIRDQDPASVDLATVIAIYAEDVAHKHARPKETAARLGQILDFFGTKRLNYLNKKTCEEYVAARGPRPQRVANWKICEPPSATIGKLDYAQP